MIRTIILLWLSVLALSVFGQQSSPKAINILDHVSEQINNYQALKLDFTFIHEDLRQETKKKRQGTLYLKGEKYKINMPHTHIYYNGETLWNHLTGPNEVNVLNPDSDTASGALDFTNPKHLFTLHEGDYKTRYLESFTKDDETFHKIDLYPKNKDVDYHRIRVWVDKQETLLYFVKVYGKSGNHYTFKANEVETNTNLPEDMFQFDKSEHPDAEIIDMRF